MPAGAGHLRKRCTSPHPRDTPFARTRCAGPELQLKAASAPRHGKALARSDTPSTALNERPIRSFRFSLILHRHAGPAPSLPFTGQHFVVAVDQLLVLRRDGLV